MFFGVTGNDCPIPAPVSHETLIHLYDYLCVSSLIIHVFLAPSSSLPFAKNKRYRYRCCYTSSLLLLVPIDHPLVHVYRNHDELEEREREREQIRGLRCYMKHRIISSSISDTFCVRDSDQVYDVLLHSTCSSSAIM